MKTKNFVKKVNEIKEKNELDISAWGDLSIGLMNLVSLEEHAFFSYLKTHDDKFLDMLETFRELRKRLLKLIVKDDDKSEKWCMSKHLLATSMRLYEVGNRLLHEGKKKEAVEMYHDAAETYGLFWGLNSNAKGKIKISGKEEKGIFASIKKMLECCIE